MANQIESLFQALADPTRRAVVEHLAQGPASVGTLHAPHAMALPTFLRHLKVLEDSGLVQSRKAGRVRTVQLRPGALAAAEDWLAAQRTVWDRRLDRLQTLAEHIELNDPTPE